MVLCLANGACVLANSELEESVFTIFRAAYLHLLPDKVNGSLLVFAKNH